MLEWAVRKKESERKPQKTNKEAFWRSKYYNFNSRKYLQYDQQLKYSHKNKRAEEIVQLHTAKSKADISRGLLSSLPQVLRLQTAPAD